MDIIDLVVGKPIKTSDERAEQIGPDKSFLHDGESTGANPGIRFQRLPRVANVNSKG
jgi:hypothetical protein